MSHYARIENDTVVEVIVAEQDFVDGLDGEWVQTSYRTVGNTHPEGTPLRKNYAGIGYTYNRELDAFIPPKPEADTSVKPAIEYTLNTTTGLWEPVEQ